MQYSYRPNLFIKEETLLLTDGAIEHTRNGRTRRTIDLQQVRWLQHYSSGTYLDENLDQVRGITCRMQLAKGWPLMFRSTSYLGPSKKITPMVKDQKHEFRAFTRELLTQLVLINPDLPVKRGSSGYAWMFLAAGLFVFLMFAGLGYWIVAAGNGPLSTRFVVGPLAIGFGGWFGYFLGSLAKDYWPTKSTVSKVLETY